MSENIDDLTPEEIEAPEENTPEPPKVEADPEAESEARRYGWKPKEEFTLAPDGWVDASRFLELPSTQVKVMRDLNKRLEKELREYGDRMSRVQSVSEVAINRVREQERAAYEAKLAEIEAQKRAAVEVGDTHQYDRLAEQQRRMQPPAVEAPAPQIVPEVKEYLDTAKWVKDPQAFNFARDLIDQTPAVQRLPPLEQVKWAERQLREVGQFSQHFAAPAEPVRPAASKVDGGGMGMLGRKAGKTAADLPPDVRKIAESFVKEGIFKTVDEYAGDYFAQGGV